ncbi:MAG: hypothetical protein IE931_03465 [Sphingobacteriales bacterium]|nr:hypothetical protein [Sphingobacteriales bacterium]
METLEINKANALTAHQEANEKGKKLLENLFGKKVFQLDVKSRITSYEDACEELEREQIELSDFNFLPAKDREAAFGFHQITTIIEAYNEGWQPDWTDSNETKYYPWFRLVGSGVGFSYDVYGCGDSHTYVGSRLVLKSSDLAIHVGKTFIDIYNKFLTL